MIDGIYHYTGMGVDGDQELDFMQNKTIAESGTNGIHMHFFEVFKAGEYIYMGRVILAKRPYEARQKDENNNERTVWIFPLRLLDENDSNAFIDNSVIDELYAEQRRTADRLSEERLKMLAEGYGSEASSRNVKTKTYVRNQYIAEYTRRRAMGICELCEDPAPFKDTRGNAYLESHHIQWLSRDGTDRIDNTAALCPNCHKRMHVLNAEDDIKKLKSARQVMDCFNSG
jgi:5-methylcytosine-specific restriction protein A